MIYKEGKRERNLEKKRLLPQFLIFLSCHHRVFPKAVSAYRGLKAIGDEGQWGPPP
jgi:hypothetical protein